MSSCQQESTTNTGTDISAWKSWQHCQFNQWQQEEGEVNYCVSVSTMVARVCILPGWWWGWHLQLQHSQWIMGTAGVVTGNLPVSRECLFLLQYWVYLNEFCLKIHAMCKIGQTSTKKSSDTLLKSSKRLLLTFLCKALFVNTKMVYSQAKVGRLKTLGGWQWMWIVSDRKKKTDRLRDSHLKCLPLIRLLQRLWAGQGIHVCMPDKMK